MRTSCVSAETAFRKPNFGSAGLAVLYGLKHAPRSILRLPRDFILGEVSFASYLSLRFELSVAFYLRPKALEITDSDLNHDCNTGVRDPDSE